MYVILIFAAAFDVAAAVFFLWRRQYVVAAALGISALMLGLGIAGIYFEMQN